MLSQPPPLTGVPQPLISRINHLLPLDPPAEESKYIFGLDADDEKEEGVWYAFNSDLERCFETHTLGSHGSLIQFREHGKQLEDLTSLMKVTVKWLNEGERTLFEKWVNQLIDAAQAVSAKIPPSKTVKTGEEGAAILVDRSTDGEQTRSETTVSRVAVIVVDSDDENNVVPGSAHNGPPKTIGGSLSVTSTPSETPKELKQTSFDNFKWKVLLREEKEAQNRKDVEQLQRRMRRHREKTKKEKVLTGKVGKKTAKMQLLSHDPGAVELPDLAKISRPAGSCWKTKQNGKRGGAIQLKHRCMNWYHPFLWQDPGL
ncbi:hypothetical protein JAAARDRAFT_187381 [Jaapia argillacea MUCL 33604]|uniref:Uncharacterized protein n=1 Tax=Jaapia argillacea MUCL 33604 TaxID=933084 RepID=A0A067QN06_9AGAM|nr:hypothetical protein JAAARDRAFT_187381 [Jaapia argillacea MUCL 33604]